VVSHDGHIKSVFDTLRQLMEPPTTKSRRIGFKTWGEPLRSCLSCLFGLSGLSGFFGCWWVYRPG